MKKVADELGGKAVGVLVPPGVKDMRDLLTAGMCWHEILTVL